MLPVFAWLRALAWSQLGSGCIVMILVLGLCLPLREIDEGAQWIGEVTAAGIVEERAREGRTPAAIVSLDEDMRRRLNAISPAGA